MENLSVEILCKIFYYLDVNDLLKCRSINKEWNSIIKNNIRIKQLVIGGSIKPSRKYYYGFTHERIKSDHYFRTDNLNLLRCSFNSILKNLKKLLISAYYFYVSNPFINYIQFFNKLTFLEHLEITYLSLNQNEVLNLPNLRIFAASGFSNYSTETSALSFNTPNLRFIRLFYFDDKQVSFKFDFPALVIHLITDCYHPNILQFENLERLGLRKLERVPVDILSLLPKLKVLSCLGTPSKNLISEILTIKKREIRADFNFYYYGLKITCKNDLDKFETVGEELEKIDKIKYFKRILDNYQSLPDVVPYITKVDFNTLIRFYNGKQIDQDFFDKFINISKLVVNDKFDLEQLVFFMKNYNLHSLGFINCSLKQEFFNQLPIYQRHINKFKIEHIDEKQQFDFEFLFEFSFLNRFKTNLTVPSSFVSKFFNKRRFGYLMKFKLNDFDIIARISVEDGKPLIEYRDELKHFETFKEMTDYIEKLEKSDNLEQSDNLEKSDNIEQSENIEQSDNLEQSENIEQSDNLEQS